MADQALNATGIATDIKINREIGVNNALFVISFLIFPQFIDLCKDVQCNKRRLELNSINYENKNPNTYLINPFLEYFIS